MYWSIMDVNSCSEAIISEMNILNSSHGFETNQCSPKMTGFVSPSDFSPLSPVSSDKIISDDDTCTAKLNDSRGNECQENTGEENDENTFFFKIEHIDDVESDYEDSDDYEEKTLWYLSQLSETHNIEKELSFNSAVVSSLSTSASPTFSHAAFNSFSTTPFSDESIKSNLNNSLVSEDECDSEEYEENVSRYLESTFQKTHFATPKSNSSSGCISQSGSGSEILSPDNTSRLKQRDSKCFTIKEKVSLVNLKKIKLISIEKDRRLSVDSGSGELCTSNLDKDLLIIPNRTNCLKSANDELSLRKGGSNIEYCRDDVADEVLWNPHCETNLKQVNDPCLVEDVLLSDSVTNLPLPLVKEQTETEIQTENINCDESLQRISSISSEGESECDSDEYEKSVYCHLSSIYSSSKGTQSKQTIEIQRNVEANDNDQSLNSFKERSIVISSCSKTMSSHPFLKNEQMNNSNDIIDGFGSSEKMVVTSTPNLTVSAPYGFHKSNMHNDLIKTVSFGVSKLLPFSSSSLISSSSSSLSDDVNDVVDSPGDKDCVEHAHSPLSSSQDPELLRSDTEDSEGYEDMVTKYLSMNYNCSSNSLCDQSLKGNTNVKKHQLSGSDNDCNVSFGNHEYDNDCKPDPGYDSSSESDFMPKFHRRSVTLRKRRVWKLLELEMMKDLADEIQKKKINFKRKRDESHSNNVSGDVLKICIDERMTNRTYKRKKPHQKNYQKDGVIKIDEDYDEFLINVDNREKKELLSVEEQEMVDVTNRDAESSNKDEFVRSSFYKDIHMGYLNTLYPFHNMDDEEEDVATVNLFCVICDVKFNNYNKLHRHMTKCHEGDVKDICRKCGLSFCTNDDFNKHFKEIHGGNTLARVSCYLCSKIFDDFDIEFMNHLKNEHKFLDLYRFKCTKCNNMFANKFMLEKHLSNNCFFCYICKNYTAKNIQRYKHHLLYHYKIHSYKCKYCDKTFITQRGCKKHITIKHDCNLKYNCDKCDKKCAVKSDLDEHYFRCHNDNIFKCNICDKEYRSIHTLNVHKKYHHPIINNFHCDVVNYTCSFCNINFNRKQLLLDHLDFKTCLCPWCKLSCACLSLLEEHITVHRSKRDDMLQCTHCNFRISNIQHYKRHFILSHPEIYEKLNPDFLKCDRCGRICSSKHHLKKHQRISCMKPKRKCGRKKGNSENCITGIESLFCEVIINEIDSVSKTYCCQFCAKTFETSEMLNMHFDFNENKCTKCNCKFVCNTLLSEHILYHDSVVNNNVAISNSKLDVRGANDDYNTKRGKTISSVNYNRNINKRERTIKTINWPYICKKCSNKYLTKTGLERHIKTVHEDDKVKLQKTVNCCKFCNNKYTTDTALYNHNKLCNEFACKYCKNLFMVRHCYDLHLLVCSKCIFCSKTFSCCYQFDEHVNLFHNNYLEKLKIYYQCPDGCGTKFITVDNFIEHAIVFHRLNCKSIKAYNNKIIFLVMPKNVDACDSVQTRCDANKIVHNSNITLSPDVNSVTTPSCSAARGTVHLSQQNNSFSDHKSCIDIENIKNNKNVVVRECDSSCSLNVVVETVDENSQNDDSSEVDDFKLTVEEYNSCKSLCNYGNSKNDEIPSSSNVL